MNTGDIAFILICSALVLLMTPALAFFYGGLGRRKNVLNTMMMTIFVMGVSSVLWIICGYSLSFSGNHFGIIGDFRSIFLMGLEGKPSEYAPNIPSYLFASFQMMFAIITPALLTGAVAGRMNFKAIFLFVILWSFVVYYPLAHMIWGEHGLLDELGSLDFAGGNVIHISSGVSGLTLSLLIGKRRGYSHVNYRTHNIPFVLLGAGLLWFGWFGFNAGSALAADNVAVHAFLTTNTTAAVAMVSWMLVDVLIAKKPTVVGAATGGILGLVAITPAAGYVPLWSCFIIGAVVSPLAFFMTSFVKHKIGYDDALDAFGCHGAGGIWGAIATGLFAQKSINPKVAHSGLVFGDMHLFVAQLISIGITIAIAVVGTIVCAKIVSLFAPLRVSKEDEKQGLDITQHGEHAYPAFNGLD